PMDLTRRRDLECAPTVNGRSSAPSTFICVRRGSRSAVPCSLLAADGPADRAGSPALREQRIRYTVNAGNCCSVEPPASPGSSLTAHARLRDDVAPHACGSRNGSTMEKL